MEKIKKANPSTLHKWKLTLAGMDPVVEGNHGKYSKKKGSKNSVFIEFDEI